MNKKALIIGGVTVTAAAAVGYYLYSQSQPVLQTAPPGNNRAGNNSAPAPAGPLNAIDQVYKLMSGSNPPTPSLVSGSNQITLATLQAKNWVNKAGAGGLSRYILGYDPQTGQVNHNEAQWIGQLVSMNQINWRSTRGVTDVWTAN